MYIVHVIPIARAIGLETLSYFSVRVIEPGSIITVPVRNKQHKALVVRVEEVQNVRQSIRTQHFQLQKIGPDAPSHVLIPESVRMLEYLAALHLTTTGAVLHSLIAADILQFHVAEQPARRKTETVYEHIPVQQTRAERSVIYKNTIRESLAKNESVLFIVPEREDVLTWSETLSTGVAKYITPIHGGLSKKIIKERLRRCVEESHALVMVTTPKFMTLPRTDIGTIIVERESSDTYVTQERPHLDYRRCAQSLAQAYNAKYMTGDSLLRMSTHRAIADHKTDARIPITTHARGAAFVEAVVKPKEERSHVFTDELRTKITTHLDAGKNIVILCARKGYATTVLCGDCGTRVTCGKCDHSVRLITSKIGQSESRLLSCHWCGTTVDAHITCTHCNSWRLVSLGFGIERIKDACTHYFPGVPVHIQDESEEPKAATLEKWYAGKGSILLLPAHQAHTLQAADVVIIPSLEAQVSIPIPDADERMVRMTTYMREFTTTAIYIQTHTGDHPLITTLISGELSAWIREELQIRKQLRLPPFMVPIICTITGKKTYVIDSVAQVLKLLAAFKPKAFAELVRVSPTTVSHTTKVFVPVAEFPHARLHEIVRALGPEWDISVQL